MLLNEMVRRMRHFLYQQSATKNREAEEHYSAKLCELRFSTTLRLIASPFWEVLRGEKGRRSLTSLIAVVCAHRAFYEPRTVGLCSTGHFAPK